MSAAFKTAELTTCSRSSWRAFRSRIEASSRWGRLIVLFSLTALGSALLLSTMAHNSQATFTVFGPADFVRGPGRPDRETRAFSVLNPNTTYTLQILNGGQNGQFRRTAKARVMLNGTRILSHRDFRHRIAFIEKRITLALHNTLVVEVRGPRGDDDDRDNDDDDDRDDSRPPSGFTLRIIGNDNDLPVIGARIDPRPKANGWNNSNTTVSFECSDRTSGIATCSTPVVVSTEGAHQAVTGRATDRAGNTAKATVSLNIDKTSPRITALSYPAPNAAGWNKSNVAVSFACFDQLSGVAACPPPVTITTEGPNRSVGGTAIDVAGNTASTTRTVNIDKSPPNLSITTPADGVTVSQATLTVAGSISDPLSGIASVICNGIGATLNGSSYSCVVPLVAGINGITVRALDVAGNEASSAINAVFGSPDPTVSEAWKGTWEVTVTSRNHETGEIVTTDVTNGSICPGEPIIPPVLRPLFQCSTVTSGNELSLSCHGAYSPQPNCNLTAFATLTSHRDGENWDGTGNWTMQLSGQCQQLDYGEDFVVSGRRVSGETSCNAGASNLVSRFFPQSAFVLSFAPRDSQ